MEIKPLASSSRGNAYLIFDGETKLLIECGIPFKDLKKSSNYEVPMNIDACFVSHEHGDHSKAIKDLLNAGVDCYMLEDTAKAKGVLNHHRTKIMQFSQGVKIKTLYVYPLEMFHDVPCAGFLIHSSIMNEKLLFATDTYMIKYAIDGLDYIMIEANYDDELVENDAQINRLYKSHMSIDTCVKYLNAIDLKSVKKIYLMHLSSRHSDEEDFKRKVQAATGVPVVVCEE